MSEWRSLKHTVEETCNKLPYVRWDRFVEWTGGLTVTGWIDRTDAYKDFVCVDFYRDGRIDFMTSSAKYSLDLYKRITGGSGHGHRKCKRIEEHFAVDNAIHLVKG
jgi:hypothetical protein